jgi:hypothetical protein
MLTGAAKPAYMPTAKPRAAARPRQRVIDQISRWLSLRMADRLYGRGAAILDGLSFVNGGDNTAFWQEACRRYQADVDARKQPKLKPSPRCLFCTEAASPDRILVGDAVSSICEHCVAEAAAVIAAARVARRRPTDHRLIITGPAGIANVSTVSGSEPMV